MNIKITKEQAIEVSAYFKKEFNKGRAALGMEYNGRAAFGCMCSARY